MAAQNNGQITQAIDTISGETISYEYDALKRLISASSTPMTGSSAAPWNETFQYDGFGNLTGKALNGTTTPIPVNAATNQLTNAYYDANGNMTSGAGLSPAYDEANRLLSTTGLSGGGEFYAYDPANQRVVSNGTFIFYGAKGEKLGTYGIQGSSGCIETGCVGSFVPLTTSVWFAGRLILDSGNGIFQDRVGTNRFNGARYYPYGEEITSTGNDRVKFATYTRDSYSGLDYADQRFYASTYGNFTTPDPSMENVDVGDPLTWNAYAYANGDPINLNDPSGLVACGALINGQTDTSLSSILTTYNDLGYLAQTIWHEAGPVYTSDLSNINNFVTEQAYIGTALENRYGIANGTLTAYTSTGGTVNPGVFGGAGSSLTDVILQAAGNNQSWGIYTNGKLNNMSTLQQVLNTDTSVGTQVQLLSGGSVNTQCFAALSAATEALIAQDGTRTEPNGVILTYWNLATNSSPAAGTQTVTKLRPNGNTFYGYYSTQQPAPVRRPPPRRPPGRGPRPQ